MQTPIKIQVSYIADEDNNIVILPSPSALKEVKAQIVKLESEQKPEAAEVVQKEVDLYERLLSQDDVTSRVFVFKRPTATERLLIQHKAYIQASETGEAFDWIVPLYARLVGVETLFTRIEDKDGNPVDGPILDGLIEHVAVLLDQALGIKKAAADFLSPSASSSPAVTP